jgi:hypothetical protein
MHPFDFSYDAGFTPGFFIGHAQRRVAAWRIMAMLEGILFMGGLGAACSIVLGVAARIFYVYEDPRIAQPVLARKDA